MGLFKQVFVWWDSQTIGTRFFTWRKGEFVGQDEDGNKYYRAKDGSGRRWVIYNGLAEASRVTPDWHGWLHYTVDEPPTGEYQPREWEKAHQPNLTGTPAAYRPKGSLSKTGQRPPATGDYQAWQP